MNFTSTIAAIATPIGQGGVAIIRLSGQHALLIAKKILKKSLTPRYAHYLSFFNENDQMIDKGIVLYFKAPHSFTGEDIVEFHGHGGAVVIDLLLEAALAFGAILAKPGEFSERAFHHNKLDLAQAEAISDLIAASSKEAALSAIRSLKGEFSMAVHAIVKKIIHLRVYVEAAIDFPEEEMDFLQDKQIKIMSDDLLASMQCLLHKAKQGALLKEGMTVVIAGKPNAGKSSLLNCLAKKETAIVTSIEGTTRDILSENIQIDGLPLHIIDTAGLRQIDHEIEKIGIHKAIEAIEGADLLIWLLDLGDFSENASKKQIEKKAHDLIDSLTEKKVRLPHLLVVKNKVDLFDEATQKTFKNTDDCVYISLKENKGIHALKKVLKKSVGYNSAESGVFIARRRHITALRDAETHIHLAIEQLTQYMAGELMAEELKLAQESLNLITGTFTSNDLLGEIFSSFCIGK
jgi:tRNA modification GTPase